MFIPPRDEETIDDLFSLDDPFSLTKQIFSGTYVTLNDYEIPAKELDKSYQTVVFNVANDKDLVNFYPKIAQIAQGASFTGKHVNFISAVQEAFKNAYQHGNKKDSEKHIAVASRKINDGYEVIVRDEGGEIRGEFIPFILRYRKGTNKVLSFYHFAPSAPQLPENGGVGTAVIHTSCDEVNYYKNALGGLDVQMIVRKIR